MDSYEMLRQNFLEFQDLDIRKLEDTITQPQRMRWAELHDYLMLELFDTELALYHELRTSLRLPLNISMEYVHLKDKVKYTAITKDVSMTGSCLPYNPKLAVGDELILYFFIGYNWKFVKWNKRFKIGSIVRWARPYEHSMGIEFFHIKPEEMQQIQKLIFWNLERIIEIRRS
jgi:hypothetical protein